jgi:two-component system, response regulator PdtaR
MGDLVHYQGSRCNDHCRAPFTGMAHAIHGAPQVRPPLVLIVEDESFLREITAEYLSDCGFAVLQAESADDAIGVLQEQDHIGAVFSDIQMPGSMNGVGLAHWISETLPDVKVLLTSGRIMPATAREWTFLAKPYNMAELERRLREMVVPT